MHTCKMLIAGAMFGMMTGNGRTAMGQGASTHPDVVGVWKMDTTKFAKRDDELAALTLTVSFRGDTLGVVTDVLDTGQPPTQMRQSYLPQAMLAVSQAGAESNAPGSFRWDADTLVIQAVQHRPDRTLQIEERWMFDADGRTLRRFQSVIDGTRHSRQTLVFTRQ